MRNGICTMSTLFNRSNEDYIHVLRQLEEISRVYERSVHGYLCTGVCAYGIVANLINITVLTRPWMRTAVNIILAAIAFCDIGCMLSYLVFQLHFGLSSKDGLCHSEFYSLPWLYFILFHQLFSIVLHTTSLWLAVVLAFVRLLVIRRSRMARVLTAPHVIYLVLFSTCTAIILLSIPLSFTTAIVEYEGPEWKFCRHPDNSTKYTVDLSPLARTDNCFLLRASLWISGLLFKLVPCLLLTAFVGGLLRAYTAAKERNHRIRRVSMLPPAALAPNVGPPLWRCGDDAVRRPLLSSLQVSAANGHHLQPPTTTRRYSAVATAVRLLHAASPTVASRRSQSTITVTAAFTHRTTVMLTAILLIFLATEVPQVLISVVGGLYPADVYSDIYPIFANLLDLLSLTNSSVNFLLYCAMSSRFRDTFHHVYVRRLVRFWTACTSRRRPPHGIHEGMRQNIQLTTIAVPKFKWYVLKRPTLMLNRNRDQFARLGEPSHHGTCARVDRKSARTSVFL